MRAGASTESMGRKDKRQLLRHPRQPSSFLTLLPVLLLFLVLRKTKAFIPSFSSTWTVQPPVSAAATVAKSSALSSSFSSSLPSSASSSSPSPSTTTTSSSVESVVPRSTTTYPTPPHAAGLQDLIDQGILTIIIRRPDYKDRRGDLYHEPEEIYLIGTAHTSSESAAAVARVIREVQPCNVVLEMCKSRSGLTALNDSRLLEEVNLPTLLRTALFGVRSSDSSSSSSSGSFPSSSLSSSSSSSSSNQKAQALDRSIRLAGGRGPLILQYCLVAAVKQLGKLLKIQFGEEFRVARQASQEVGAQVVLGDRPIELTMRRAWASMQPEERGVVVLAMASLLLGLRTKATVAAAAAAAATGATASGAAAAGPAAARGGGGERVGMADVSLTLFSAPTSSGGVTDTPSSLPPSSIELQGYQGTNDELLETLQRFGSHFPSLYSSLIHERDRYLAWATKRSKAVNGSRRIVTVLGALHVPGVIAAIEKDNGGDTLNFSNVARLPPVGEGGGRGGGGEGGGMILTEAYRKVLLQLAWAWGKEKGPGLLRDLTMGAVVGEAVSVGWREWGDEVGAAILAAVEGAAGGMAVERMQPFL